MTTSFTFTITNEASAQQLGSVHITAPTGFTITGAPRPATFRPSSALFLHLSLAPSATTTLTVTAAAPCSGGSYRWRLEAKQSNDYKGPRANDFQLDPASAASLSGSVTGSCSLAFTTDGQPAGTVAGTVITSGFDSQGGPVTVAVLAASGKLAANSAAEVTVAILANPGHGSLSGTVQEQAIGGISSFPSLSISKPGIGYTLQATSPGIASAASAHFTVWGSLQHCSTRPCSASSSTATTAWTVTTSSTAATQLFGAGLGGVSYSCAGMYRPVSAPLSFDVLSSSGAAQSSAQFSASLEISKSAVQASGRTGAAHWQICYASTQSFTARAGTSGKAVIGGVTYHTGLLPDCSNTPAAPCVQARHKDNAGDVIVTFLASGDPVGKG